MNWQEQLISLYLFVCKEFYEGLGDHCQRRTNHADLGFTDEEVITIFLFGIIDKNTTLKDIYRQTHRHLSSWFPQLPSYTAFIQRINRLYEVFPALIERLQMRLSFNFEACPCHLIDAMPIILAHRTRRFNAKVAKEICSPNGFCVTKKLHYYGVKLHVLSGYQKGSLPIPSYIQLTPANIHDRLVYDQLLPLIPNTVVVADKAYQIEGKPIVSEGSVTLYTPVKRKKGQVFLDSADKLLSAAISHIRQPIESFFNWIEEKTKIQIASKVRSYQGLMVHVFGRLAAAFFILLFKVCS